MSETIDETKKPRGRPKEMDGQGVRVSTWLPESTYDQLTKYALRHDRSLSSLLRESLKRFPPNK
jgi:hypothetical protein